MGDLVKVNRTLTESQLDLVGNVLMHGGVVCMAVDTVYGLHCVSRLEESVRRIALIKGRESRGFIVLVGELSWLETIGTELPGPTRRLADAYWPGPLTIVLKAKSGAPRWITGPRGTVAVRWPKSEICEQLFEVLKEPLVSTSANLRGKEPCLRGVDAAREFLERVDLVLDSGDAPASFPSTVVDATAAPQTVVRQGRLLVDPALL